MGKIIKNGIEYGGSSNEAININYSNTSSGLAANTVQGAIDKIAGKVGPDILISTTYSNNGDLFWDPNGDTSILNTTNWNFSTDSKPMINLLSKGDWAFLAIDLKASTELTAGTEYNIITDCSAFLDYIGSTYIIANASTTNGELCSVFINTQASPPRISMKPRVAVSANRRLNCALAFPVMK